MEYRLLDEDFSPEEQLPRRMEVSIRESPPGTAVMMVNGVRTGDPLQDNNHEEDHYRFHDVFHLAHMAYLGWSPVHRALMGKGRQSHPMVLEVEDSRRAVNIEEGLVALVFSYASRRDFLEGATGIEPWLWEHIEAMTSFLEVSVRSREQWEEAILHGYSCWRLARQWGGCDVYLDLRARTMDTFRPSG